MKRLRFNGVFTALVTPFKNGDVDFSSLRKLIQQQLRSGIEGFVVCGSTGEAATLDLEEKLSVSDFVISEVAKQVPVIIGVGTNNTAETCQSLQHFERLKPDGFLVVVPYYNKPPQRGLVAHFSSVASSTNLPIILYNVPGRTVISMRPETVGQVISLKDNIVAIKEASADLSLISALRASCPDSFLITSGDDETALDAMALGAGGVISVVSHVIPSEMVKNAKKVMNAYANGGAQAAAIEAKAHNERLKKISQLLFCETNPIPVKWLLAEMGIIESSELRLPLIPLPEDLQLKLREEFKTLGVLS